MEMPKILSKIIDGFELSEIIDWTKEMIRFYINPVSFFRKIFLKKKEHQYRQIIFYFILFLIFLILTSSSFSIFGSSKSLFIISIHTLFFGVKVRYPVTRKLRKNI